MKVYQRQIVEVPFNLPQGVINHPVLVLSVNDAIEFEEAFVAVMITSKKYDDEYTFEIYNAMLESGRLSRSYAEIRLHLISFFKASDVIVNNHPNTKMKLADFARIVTEINRRVFGRRDAS